MSDYVIDRDAEHAEFKRQVDELLAKPDGLDMWCWLRGLASEYLELRDPDLEEIGSSDVTCVLYEVWVDAYRQGVQSYIHDGLGFQINCRSMEYRGW